MFEARCFATVRFLAALGEWSGIRPRCDVMTALYDTTQALCLMANDTIERLRSRSQSTAVTGSNERDVLQIEGAYEREQATRVILRSIRR
jgi:hypothetical protein